MVTRIFIQMTRLSNQIVSDLSINSQKGKQIFRFNHCIVHSDLFFFKSILHGHIFKTHTKRTEQRQKSKFKEHRDLLEHYSSWKLRWILFTSSTRDKMKHRNALGIYCFTLLILKICVKGRFKLVVWLNCVHYRPYILFFDCLILYHVLCNSL